MWLALQSIKSNNVDFRFLALIIIIIIIISIIIMIVIIRERYARKNTLIDSRKTP